MISIEANGTISASLGAEGFEAELAAACARGPGALLCRLALRPPEPSLSPSGRFWQRAAYACASRLLCGHAELDAKEAQMLAGDAPQGCLPEPEELKAAAIEAASRAFFASMSEASAASRLGCRELLTQAWPEWEMVGRACFDLSEDPEDPQKPFCVRSSFAIGMGIDGRSCVIPLTRAIQAFAKEGNQQALDNAVSPLVEAAKKSQWARLAMVDPSTANLLRPIKLHPAGAYEFLREIPKIEACGMKARLPAGWGKSGPRRPAVRGWIGEREPGMLGPQALLDFKMEVSLGGKTLDEAQVKELANAAGLARINGQWAMADPDGVGAAIKKFKQAADIAQAQGLSFSQAMGLAASARGAEAASGGEEADGETKWVGLQPGAWLDKALAQLRDPQAQAALLPGELLAAQLRPYQQKGLSWLWSLHRLGLGACLADDMGLGKTIQILSLLLVAKRELGAKPSLLAAPASLLQNWAAEAKRFAPSLNVVIWHGGSKASEITPKQLADIDLVICSYGGCIRGKWLEQRKWRFMIADEAQALKNPETQTAKCCKRIGAESRIALTGTPVENRLSDLWSLMDFTHPGLLGNRAEFGQFHAWLLEQGSLARLRGLVRPYLLRRKKTDKEVIDDLPEKIESRDLCELSERQAALYQATVDELSRCIASSSGIERQGLMLSYLTKLKQICNHPAHYLRDGEWHAADSGKIQLLREIASEIAESGEKLLVFTQYQEAVDPLHMHLEAVFGKKGLKLDGRVPPGPRRQALVDQFQDEGGPPFMVLTVKAGGNGLTLTGANHVMHFDRWWNPAVENQATDRAYRIGQSKSVWVRKLVCKGTIEEKIDALISSKIQLAEDAIDQGANANLGSLSNEELLALVSLDAGGLMELE